MQEYLNYFFLIQWCSPNQPASSSTIGYARPWSTPTWSSPSITPTLSPLVSDSTSKTGPPAPSPTVFDNYACASVNSLVATATEMVPTIPASVAWECLQSVPLNTTAAISWLESLKPYISWQTTLAYLKDPPGEYLEPPVDVYGKLDDMIANVDRYGNEYDLEFNLYRLFQTTHDGHFRYLPTLVSGVLTFGRPLAVVSLSSDGYELPKLYVYSDILASANTAPFETSAITTINGIDAVTYLEVLSQFGSLQDPDALYNSVMYNLAHVSLGKTVGGAGAFAGGGRGAYFYPGSHTVLTFENGSSLRYENFARVLQNFSGISTGQDVFDRFLMPPIPRKATQSPTLAPSPTATPAPGYPVPIIRQINNLIGGYYLSSPNYSEIAVLSVPSFAGTFSVAQSFQQVALDFIAQSKTAGKTKLVIDVSANGGGTVLQGYSLFLNLFPDLVPYDATRLRSHEAVNIMGQVVSNVAGPDYPWNLTDPPGPDDVLNDFLGYPFDFRADLNETGQSFNSWPEKYGPHSHGRDIFTSVIRRNLSDPTTILTSGLIVNGYQNRTGIVPTQPYAAEDIVILYDGYCASTCAIFSDFMRHQAGVRTVAIGGRPQYCPMQAVGGVKGTNSWSWQGVCKLVNATFALATPEQRAQFDDTELASYSTLPFVRSSDSNGYLNVRDGLRQGDETQTPMQFLYEAADCRIWYEAGMMVDVEVMWEKVVDVTWGGASCVDGVVGLGKKEGKARKIRKEIRKRAKRSVDADKIQALRDGVSLFTDLKGHDVSGDGYMLP